MDAPVGFGVSLACTAICALNEKGYAVTEARLAGAPDEPIAFLPDLIA